MHCKLQQWDGGHSLGCASRWLHIYRMVGEWMQRNEHLCCDDERGRVRDGYLHRRAKLHPNDYSRRHGGRNNYEQSIGHKLRRNVLSKFPKRDRHHLDSVSGFSVHIHRLERWRLFGDRGMCGDHLSGYRRDSHLHRHYCFFHVDCH